MKNMASVLTLFALGVFVGVGVKVGDDVGVGVVALTS